jgi:hypothetical protein
VDRLEIAQSAGEFGDVVFLKKADGGDSGGSGFEASGGVCKANASEGKHRKVVLAGTAKGFETRRFRTGVVFLLEDRGEQSQIRALSRCLLDIVRVMTGLADGKADRSMAPS